MADQVYNLTQTGAEVQGIINDANNAKGAGATTSLTTDYIMLKDTNGQYHKIQKDSFTEAVRNTLASLLVNNDKGTTISQIAAIASGDFGSVTPANLASVLGVWVSKRISNILNLDLNNISESGVYVCSSDESSSVLNKPTGYRGPTVLIHFKGLYYSSQVLFGVVSSGCIMYFRQSNYNDASWNDWKQVSTT